MRQAEGTLAVAHQHGLGVRQDGRAGGRVAGVPYRHVARQARHHLLAEDVGDEAHAAVRARRARAVHGDDARRLLAAVLQAVQAEVDLADRVGNP